MHQRERGGVLTILIAGIVVLGLAAVAGWWFLLRDSAKPRAEIEPTPVTEGGTLGGVWVVTPNDTAGSFAGFRIDEEFVGAIANTATGRTTDVEGSLEIDGDRVTSATVKADLTALTSDPAFRANALRDQGLETSKFPEATFELTDPVVLPEPPTKGTTTTFDATGDLTIHGVTRKVTIPLEGRWDGTAIQVVGHLPVALADYGMTKPSAPRVASIADEGELELQLFFLKR
ncbi:MAG: YceI family protein [Actinobacteria bacterium]|nr:YceI family protein [Actinomycetota bacterium]